MSSQNNKYTPCKSLSPNVLILVHAFYILVTGTTICQLSKLGTQVLFLAPHSPLSTLNQSFKSVDSTGFMCLDLLNMYHFLIDLLPISGFQNIVQRHDV